jgi:hypothetical protein
VLIALGELRSMAAEIVSYICEYQRVRGDKEKHHYSPLHLFFEEFKQFIVKLAPAPMSMWLVNVFLLMQ